MPDKISLVVNVETGQTYQLSDLFDKTANYRELVSDLIRELDQDTVDFPLQSFVSIADDDGFYLEEDGIVVYFQPYYYTPYAAGFPEFRLPYSRLDPVLRKDGGLWAAMGK